MTTQAQTGQEAEAPDRPASGSDPYPPQPFEEGDIGDEPNATTRGDDSTARNSGGGGGG